MKNKAARSRNARSVASQKTSRNRHNITFSSVAHARGKALAKADRRSFSSELEYLVDKEWLARNAVAQAQSESEKSKSALAKAA